mgnify:FL=1
MNLKSVLMELYRDIIKEVLDFNNIAILDYQKVNSNQYKFEQNGLDIEVLFQESDFDEFEFPNYILPTNHIFNVAFSVNDDEGQWKKTTLGEMLPIYNTVREITTEFVNNVKPDVLVVISMDRLGLPVTDKSKDKIYELMMRKFAPTNYGIVKAVFKPANMVGFCLYKVKRKR